MIDPRLDVLLPVLIRRLEVVDNADDLCVGPYRFFFYSNEHGEPAHIHVRRDRALAKFWLEPVALAKSRHFAAHEMSVISQHVETNLQKLLEAWNEHHDG